MTKLKHKVKAVIFDMDGTIIKTEHIWKAATKDVLIKRGFDRFSSNQENLLLSLSGSGLTKASEILKKEFNLADSIERLISETKEIAANLFQENVEFIEGFEQFHKKLQFSLIPTSIATNADGASLLLINQKLNLEQFFGKNIYNIDHVGNKAKPNPALFLHAAKQLNVKPHECIVFEDSLFGFEAAKAAGMKCIAIKNSINQKDLNKVHDSINSYHEAEEALCKVSS